MADSDYDRLRQIWLARYRNSERGSLVHWVYWLLVHLEETVFIFENKFEADATTIRAEVNKLIVEGGDASSPTALEAHCPKLWGHIARALASHVELDGIIRTFIQIKPIAIGPQHQLNALVDDFAGGEASEWEQSGEAANRTRFKIIVELLCYAANSTSTALTPSILEELKKLGGAWEWVPAQRPGSFMLRRRRAQHSLGIRRVHARLSPRKQVIYDGHLL